MSWSSRLKAPNTGSPTAVTAARTACSWLSLPSRLSTTPARLTPRRKVWKPCTTAAIESLDDEASTTRITGAASAVATSAVEEGVPSAAPSKRPITPSTMSRSFPAPARAPIDGTQSSPHIQASMLRGVEPEARAW